MSVAKRFGRNTFLQTILEVLVIAGRCFIVRVLIPRAFSPEKGFFSSPVAQIILILIFCIFFVTFPCFHIYECDPLPKFVVFRQVKTFPSNMSFSAGCNFKFGKPFCRNKLQRNSFHTSVVPFILFNVQQCVL